MKSKKEYQFKKIVKVRKITIKKIKIISDRKKLKEDEIVKTSNLKTISNKRNSY
jgi:hypothetical protein